MVSRIFFDSQIVQSHLIFSYFNSCTPNLLHIHAYAHHTSSAQKTTLSNQILSTQIIVFIYKKKKKREEREKGRSKGLKTL